MPRSSYKQKAINDALLLQTAIMYMVIDYSMEHDVSPLDTPYTVLLLLQMWHISKLERTRYGYRKRYRSTRRAAESYQRDLAAMEQSGEESEASVKWLSDEEFLQKYRMSKESFVYVLDTIKDDPVFQRSSRGRPQRPVAHQLMTTLKALGSEGNGFSNPNLRHVFHTGRGTSSDYIRRVVTALRNNRADYIRWPNAEEKDRIKSEIQDLSGLPNCVGVIDGTLFPLAFEPQTPDGPDYKGRKHGYTLSFLIVCDHRRLITYYYGGWPGCSHDYRIFRNSEMFNNPEQYFERTEYILADSAFRPSWYCVPAFTNPTTGGFMDAEESLFNTHMSKARVISEHTIGLLKGRFPWLRSIRKSITEDPEQFRSILHLIDATIILHNMLILQGDASDDWEDSSVFTDIAETNGLPAHDELNQPVPEAADPDYRRTQLKHYILETFGAA
jgi:hypothetical protein